MENNLIIFGSVTLAMKSRNLLLKNNIKSGLVRTPIHLNRNHADTAFMSREILKWHWKLSGVTVLLSKEQPLLIPYDIF